MTGSTDTDLPDPSANVQLRPCLQNAFCLIRALGGPTRTLSRLNWWL